MVPRVADAIAELSQFEAEDPGEPEPVRELFADLAGRPVPGGLLRRLWALGGLQRRSFALTWCMEYEVVSSTSTSATNGSPKPTFESPSGCSTPWAISGARS